MKIVVDDREKQPYSEDFYNPLGLVCITKRLKTGDYTILGKEEEVSIERKSLNDFVNSITWERKRFEKELIRGSKLKFFAVIIEASYQDIINEDYYPECNPKSILSTVYKWTVKYKVPILFAGDREGGALATLKMLEGVKYYGT